MDRSLLQQAITHHQAGHLMQAETLYRQLILKEPRNADTRNLLGVLARQQGKHLDAIGHARSAIELRRCVPDYHLNLAEAYRALGRWDEAVAAYRKTLNLAPSDAEACHGLGAALAGSGALVAAVESLRRAIGLRPNLVAAVEDLAKALLRQGNAVEAEAECRRSLARAPTHAGLYFALASTLASQQKLADAVNAYRRAIELKPDWAEANVNLSGVLARAGRFEEAAAAAESALRTNDGLAEAHLNLGAALEKIGQSEKAIACYRRAIQLHPGYAEVHNNLGLLLSRMGLLSEAEAILRRAIELKGGYAEAYSNLGNCLKDQGRLDQAIDAYRKALQLQPDFAPAQSNLLFALNYASSDPAEAFEEHRLWGARYPDLDTLQCPAAPESRPSGGRLRIGYVSPDLREHSVSFFMEPILAQHDRRRFEVFCYNDATRPDTVSCRLRGYAAVWRDCAALSDQQLAETVRQDRIDILVDLAGHTANNRLRTFAQRPAPLQISYLGYPNTTGLKQIDWRITDEIADPVGGTEQWHTEGLLRIPAPFACYRPSQDAPPVTLLPALASTGRECFTLGCFNQVAKISDVTVRLWSEILRRLPESRLVLKSKSLRDGPTRAGLSRRFAACGVASAQIVMLGPERTVRQHLERYGAIDLALDTFPYHGTTTTCEALWMGVPVLSMAGEAHVSRVGATLLHAVELDELVAQSPEEYVNQAMEWSANLKRLSELRMSLRTRLTRSRLLNARTFTLAYEAAITDVWGAR